MMSYDGLYNENTNDVICYNLESVIISKDFQALYKKIKDVMIKWQFGTKYINKNHIITIGRR